MMQSIVESQQLACDRVHIEGPARSDVRAVTNKLSSSSRARFEVYLFALPLRFCRSVMTS